MCDVRKGGSERVAQSWSLAVLARCSRGTPYVAHGSSRGFSRRLVMNEQEAIMWRPMTRRSFLALTGAGLAGTALLSATGHVAEAQRARSRRSITLGIIGWDEDTAISTLTKILLVEDLGYTSVRDTLADVGILFEGVGAGDLAAFQDVWMPNHTAYYNRVKNQVEMLPPWYIGTTKFSMAVPSYMHITSIAQLNATKAKVIYGIEPGAVITERIK